MRAGWRLRNQNRKGRGGPPPFPELECAVKAKVGDWPYRGGKPFDKAAPSTDPDPSAVKDSSSSMSVRTRKTVNYARIGRSQRKLWWRLVEILTCKSFFKCGYRGERLIELSSSWFPPKFPSG